MRSVKRVIGYSFLFLLLLLAAYLTVANLVFYSSLPADLPCRDCTGDARSAAVNGFDLYFRELGSDSGHAPVVVLHGGPGHSSLSFRNGFDFLAEDRRVIYYDQRGSGNSQIQPDSAAYTIEQLVEELETLRRDVIQAEKIVVIGHSAGGALAQRYALRYPQRVERMVLVGSIRINNGVAAPMVFDRILPGLFLLSGFPPADAQERDHWFTQIGETGAAARLHDPANADLLRNSGYMSFATWREVSRSLEGPDYRDSLANLPVPTLIVYGTADSAYTGEATSTDLCSLLPDCAIARFEKSGHYPFLEEPERFAQVVGEFVKK